jgi:hypothetical protein
MERLRLIYEEIEEGGCHTLPSELRSKDFSGAALFAPFAKGAGFDVDFRPTLVPFSRF